MGFNCKIYHPTQPSETVQGTGSAPTSAVAEGENNILHNENYKSLKDIATDLGLSYQQVADLSSRKEKRKYQEFKYFPKIEINRIKKESRK